MLRHWRCSLVLPLLLALASAALHAQSTSGTITAVSVSRTHVVSVTIAVPDTTQKITSAQAKTVIGLKANVAIGSPAATIHDSIVLVRTDTVRVHDTVFVHDTTAMTVLPPAPAPNPLPPVVTPPLSPPADPPSGATEPAFAAGINTVIMQDNFDGYASATAMGATPLGTAPRITPLSAPVADGLAVDPSKFQLIPGRNGTGKAIRLAYTGAVQGSVNALTWNAPATPDLTTHYVRYWARVTLGGSLTGPGMSGTLAVKWIELWHRHADNTRIQFNTHDHLPCPAQAHATYWEVYDRAETTCQGNQPVGPYFPDVADGQWHRFTYQYRPNTSAGSRDGVARMWVDGVKVIDISASAIGVTPPGGEKPWCNADDVDALAVNDGVTVVRWGSAQTTRSPAWTYDIDDFIWWTDTAATTPTPATNPGWQ